MAVLGMAALVPGRGLAIVTRIYVQRKGPPSMVTQAPETRIVDTYRVACDGGEGALGHPRVWLSIPHETGFVECPYCDAKLVHRDFEGKV